MLHPVRIGIATRVAMARLAVWSPGAVFVNNEKIANLSAGVVYELSSGRLVELATGKTIFLPVDQRAQIAAPDYRVWANNRWWSGSLEVINVGKKVTLINLLDLEDYLKGVVPSEMPANWHIEALKAQAVAARSYAYAHMGTASKWWRTEGYDLVPDVRDQAYKGLAAEQNSTTRAVWSTRGIILKDAGKVKAGFYRATVGDTAFENLNMRKTSVSSAHLEQLTGVQKIVGVSVKQWGPDFNAHSIQVIGAKKTREVDGIILAKMLNFSTAGILDIHPEGSDWVFTYRGPGNGARGLSQNGANALARHGWNWEQILHQYYHDPNTSFRLDYMDHYQAPVLAQPPRAPTPASQATADTDSVETAKE